MGNWKVEGVSVIEDTDGVPMGTVVDDEAPPEDVEPDESFDPADYTIDDVKTWVEANPEYAADVLEAEQAGKNRVTLVDWLSGQG